MRSSSLLGSSFVLLASTACGLLAPGCGGGAETTGTTTTTTATETTTTTTTSTTTTSTTTGTGGSGGGGTTTSSTTTSSGTGGGCNRVPGPADGPRKVVISHPYKDDGAPSTKWEVLDLDAAGKLSQSGTTFDMARAFWGEVVFTPDGKVGIVVQDNGSLGVIRFDDAGALTVVHTAFQGSFYAGSVVMDPSGEGAYVLDPNWRENHGGLYRISIGCDGTLTDLGIVAPAKLPYGMVRLGNNPSLAVLSATDVLASKAGENAHLLDLGGSAPTLLAGAPAFPDDNAIVSSVARTHDDRFVLIGDFGEDGTPNRVAVVSVNGGALKQVQSLTPFVDPVAILTSPFDNAAIVVSGYENAVFTLDYDPANATAPFAITGEPTYIGKSPELPASAVMIERGALRGRFYVSELSAVRQFRFEQDGKVTDLGGFGFGDGLEDIVGAIGVTP